MSELLVAADISHEVIGTEPYLNLSHPYKLVEGEHYNYIDRCCAEAKTCMSSKEVGHKGM